MTRNQINISVPALIDTKEFHPTCAMQKVILAYLKEISDPGCDKVTNPARHLAAMGHDRSNWYKWQKHAGFRQWWNKTIEEELTGGILQKVHTNLANLAMTQQNPSVIKLFLERFDKEYKPATRQEHEHDFPPGPKPPKMDPQEAIARSKARIAEANRQEIERIMAEQQIIDEEKNL